MDGCLSASKSPLCLWIKGCSASLPCPLRCPGRNTGSFSFSLGFSASGHTSILLPSPDLVSGSLCIISRPAASGLYQANCDSFIEVEFTCRVYGRRASFSHLHDHSRETFCTFLLFCFVTENVSPWVLLSQGNPAHRMSPNQIKAPEEQWRRDPFHPSDHYKIYGLCVRSLKVIHNGNFEKD